MNHRENDIHVYEMPMLNYVITFFISVNQSSSLVPDVDRFDYLIKATQSQTEMSFVTQHPVQQNDVLQSPGRSYPATPVGEGVNNKGE